ncbi:MAG: sigma factor-like helix-turn-helix DNA-binding protein, partial [Pirellulaceae bacterium]|nr:sigma factor-like helix-turn-helix DNA-binding protein [Pirellulaceae bacterium]
MSDANLSNDPIEQHLTVSGLIQNIVRDLGCRTIGDLCELDIKTVESVKGVGVKKVDEFRRLINNARQLAGQTIVINTVPKVDLSGIVFDQSSLLVFVPSILKVAFEQLGVNTVEKLLSLDISAIGNQPGWGEKKKTAAVAIKELYSRLATIQPDAEIELVGDLVPKDVLPADSIGCMLLDKFILGQFRDTLQGKALLEASDLRMLLSRVFRMKSTVVGLNEMEWRDVPLQVGVKVESVAEKYSLTTLGQLADFAMHGRVMDQQTQELLDVTREGNFGESSLTSLREELQRLESMGVTAYRKSIGCSLDDLECADFAWHDVPLRVNKRTRDFLRSQGVEKISEVHKVALRKQVFSKDHNKWLSVSEFPNFSERSIYELRDELSKLNSQGLERYRFGQAGSPKTFKECIDRALSELDSRQIEIVKSRCSGATQGAAGQQYSITRERARQIANSAFKKLKVYRLAAASLVSEYHETLPKCLLWVSERIRNQLHLDETWHLDFLLELAELGHERLNATTISRVPVKCVDLLRTCLRKLTKDDTTFSLQNITAIGEVSHAFKKVFATQESSVLPLEDFADCELITSDIRYKKSIADAAVDGAVPEGNLRSPAQAQSDILA